MYILKFKTKQFDIDLWPCDLRINRCYMYLFSWGNHCTKSGYYQAKESLDIEEISFGSVQKLTVQPLIMWPGKLIVFICWLMNTYEFATIANCNMFDDNYEEKSLFRLVSSPPFGKKIQKLHVIVFWIIFCDDRKCWLLKRASCGNISTCSNDEIDKMFSFPFQIKNYSLVTKLGDLVTKSIDHVEKCSVRHDYHVYWYNFDINQ